MNMKSKLSRCHPACGFTNNNAQRRKTLRPSANNLQLNNIPVLNYQQQLKDEIITGNLEGVITAITNGALINAMFQPKEDFNALMIACFKGHSHILAYLLDNKANPNTTNSDLITPLMCVCFGSCNSEDQVLQCVKLLISNGIDINSADKYGTTSLMHACQCSHLSVVNELITKNVDVNKQDANGWTALFWAVNVGNFELIKMLTSAGANQKIKDKKERMAYSIAVSKKGRLMKEIALFLCPEILQHQLKRDYPLEYLECDDEYDVRDHGAALLVSTLDCQEQVIESSRENISVSKSDEKSAKLSFYELLTTDTGKLTELGMHPIHQKLTMTFVKNFHLKQWVVKLEPSNTKNLTYVDYANHISDLLYVLKLLEASHIYLEHQYVRGIETGKDPGMDYGKLARLAELHLSQMSNLLKVVQDFISYTANLDKQVVIPSDLVMMRDSSSWSLPIVEIIACSSVLVFIVWKFRTCIY